MVYSVVAGAAASLSSYPSPHSFLRSRPSTSIRFLLPHFPSPPITTSIRPLLLSPSYLKPKLAYAHIPPRASSSSSTPPSNPMEATVADEAVTAGEGGMTVFVAGATGSTGSRIVRQLLNRGFRVRAGVLDADRARTLLPSDDPKLQIVRADVTEDCEKIAAVVGNADALVCATGFRRSWDPFAPWKVDNFGTVNLVKACRKNGIDRFVLISSILVNGAAMGQILNPAYVFLNVLGLTLIAKLQAEQYIRKSGINFTIIRPGGLRNDLPSGNVIMEPEDTLYEGTISREQVAETAVEALLCPESSFKVVEIVCRNEAPKLPFKDLFSSIPQKN